MEIFGDLIFVVAAAVFAFLISVGLICYYSKGSVHPFIKFIVALSMFLSIYSIILLPIDI